MTRANDLDRFCNISLKDWVLGTIKKVERGAKWNCAWLKTYFELGGESELSGSKSCPMKGAETLYLLGRIKGFRRFKNPGLRDIREDCSREWSLCDSGVGIHAERFQYFSVRAMVQDTRTYSP